MDDVERYIQDLQHSLAQLPLDLIREVMALLHYARLHDKQVFILGNGGSASTASHFTCDLSKGTIMPDRPRFRVIALTDNLFLLSSYGNDLGYEHVFAEQLTNLVNPGDVVIAISGSGNSANVLMAVERAREKHATTVGFTGFDGGKLKDMVDIPLVVPNDCMEQVEDLHQMLAHLLCWCLRRVPLEGDANLPDRFIQESSELRVADSWVSR